MTCPREKLPVRTLRNQNSIKLFNILTEQKNDSAGVTQEHEISLRLENKLKKKKLKNIKIKRRGLPSIKQER